jgi:hypothetical protein
MNICFYTAGSPSVSGILNMSHLIQSRPEHNYSFLNVMSIPQPAPTLVERLRKKYGELRFNDGRFDFHRDLATLDERLKETIIPLNTSSFKNGFADVVNDSKSIQFLNETKPDIIVQAGAGILKPETFTLATRATINLHHGIAPEIRGIESTFWCMFYGIKDKIGVTCHLVDETLDTGAVVKQATLSTRSTSFIDIQFDNYLLGRDVLVQSIDFLKQGGHTVRSQGEVRSYYFGIVNPFLYYAMKKRNFEPVMKISERSFKMKEKKFLV